MKGSAVDHNADGSHALGNAVFQPVVGLTAEQVPVMRSLSLSRSEVDWA